MDQYLERSHPDHPCHTGCTRIWMEGRKSWVCIRCDSEDRARPRPTVFPSMPVNPTPLMPGPDDRPVRVTYGLSPCCMCRDPEQAGRALGINCQCACHGRTIC